LSTIDQLLILLVVLVGLAALLEPGIRTAAEQVADRKWNTEGIRMEAIAAKEGTGNNPWQDNYKRCGDRRALDLIFADKETYYMLCISTFDKVQGVVYEVRRDAGLVSVRLIRKIN